MGSSEDDVPDLVSSEEESEDDYSYSPCSADDESVSDSELDALRLLAPRCLNMVAAEKWQRVLREPREKSKHIEMIRNYCLGPFLFGRSVQPAKWMMWAAQYGFTNVISVEDVVTCKCLSETDLDAVDMLDEALDLVTNYEYSIDDVKRLLDLMNRCEDEIAEADKALHEALAITHISELCQRMAKKRRIPKRSNFAVLYACRQYAHNVSRLSFGHNQDLAQEYEKNIADQNKDIELMRCQGNDFYNRGEFLPAIQKYSTALSRCAFNHLCYGNRAQCYLQIHQYKRAAVDGRRSVALNPKWVKGYYRSAQAWCGLRNYERALAINQKALTICAMLPQNCTANDRKYLENQQKYILDIVNKGRTVTPKPVSEEAVKNARNNCSRTDNQKSKTNGSKSTGSNNNECTSNLNNKLNNNNNNNIKNGAARANQNAPNDNQQKQTKNTSVMKSKKDQGSGVSPSRVEACPAPSPKPAENKHKRRDVDRLMTTLKLSVDGVMSDQPHLATQGLRECLNKIKQYTAQYYNLSRVEEQIIAYAEASSQIESASYEQVSDAHSKLLFLSEGSTGLVSMLAHYGVARTLVRQNRYREAEATLEKATKSVPKKLSEKDQVKCSPLVSLVASVNKTTLEDLLTTCRRPPTPLAICRFQKCSGYHKQEIYITDFDFEGYVLIKCLAKCLVTYHPNCWKKVRSSYKDRHSEKDFLDKPCLTPDCPDVIVDIKIYDPHHQVKRHYDSQPDKKSKEKNMKDKSVLKDADKAAKRRERKQQHHLPSKERRTSERSLDSDLLASLEDSCMSTGGSASVHTEDRDSVSIGAAEDHHSLLPDEPMTVLRKDIDDYKVVAKAKKKSKKKSKTTMSLTDFVVCVEGRGDQASEMGESTHDDFVSDGPVSEDSHKDSKIIENLYSFFLEYLEANGPTHIRDPTLQLFVQDFPQEAQKIIAERDGLTTFLLYRLQFALVDNYICLTKDIVKARNLADSAKSADAKGSTTTGKNMPSLNPDAAEFKPSTPKTDARRSSSDDTATAIGCSAPGDDKQDQSNDALLRALGPVGVESPSTSPDLFSSSLFDEDLPYTSPVVEIGTGEEKTLMQRVEQAKNVWDISADASLGFTGSFPSNSYNFGSSFALSPFLSSSYSPASIAGSFAASIPVASPPMSSDPALRSITGTSSEHAQSIVGRKTTPLSGEIQNIIQPKTGSHPLTYVRTGELMNRGSPVVVAPSTPLQHFHAPQIPVLHPGVQPMRLCTGQRWSPSPLQPGTFTGYVMHQNRPLSTPTTETKPKTSTAAVQTENDDLTKVKEELSTQSDICRALRELDSRKSKEIEELRSSIKTLNEDHSSKCERFERDVHSLRTEKNRLERENKELAETLQHLRSSYKSDFSCETNASVRERAQRAEIQLLQLKLGQGFKLLDERAKEVKSYLNNLQILASKCEEANVVIPPVLISCQEAWRKVETELKDIRSRAEISLREQISQIDSGASLASLPPLCVAQSPPLPELLTPQAWHLLGEQIKFSKFSFNNQTQFRPPCSSSPNLNPPGLPCPLPFGFQSSSSFVTPSFGPSRAAPVFPPVPVTYSKHSLPAFQPWLYSGFGGLDLGKSIDSERRAHRNLDLENQTLGSPSVISAVPPEPSAVGSSKFFAAEKVSAAVNAAAVPPPGLTSGRRLPNTIPLAMTGGLLPPCKPAITPPNSSVQFTPNREIQASGTRATTSVHSESPVSEPEAKKLCTTDWGDSPKPQRSWQADMRTTVQPSVAQKKSGENSVGAVIERAKNQTDWTQISRSLSEISRAKCLDTATRLDAAPPRRTGIPPVQGSLPATELEDEWSVVGTKKGAQKRQKLTATTSTPATATTTTVTATAATAGGAQTTFYKVMEELAKMFPEISRADLMEVVKQVRHRHENSLSGIRMEQIVELVADEIQLEKAKIESVKMMAKDQQHNLPRQHTTTLTAYGGTISAFSYDNTTVSRRVARQDDSGGEDDDAICIICRDAMSVSSTVTLDCKHQFHYNCINKWLHEQSTCPNCRVHALLHDEYPALG